MKFYKITFLVKALLIFCCASFAFVSNAKTQNTEDKKTNILITMKRDGSLSGCVEAKATDFLCPSSYSITIAADGTVIYEGVSSVKVRGRRTFTISSEKVKEFAADFERIKFFDLREKYVAEYLPNGVTRSVDHAVKTYLTVRIGDRTKTVYNFYGAPKELNDLQEKLDQITKHLQK